MGRYRPPRPKGSNYITPEGECALRQELKQLWHIERPEVTASVHEAAKNGDRSENGDYIYGKKRLREIDSRVRFINKRLETLIVVKDAPKQQQKIYFGAWVTVKGSSGETTTYRIVGPDEFDLAKNKLSMDSPLAKALLGKTLNETIHFHSPAGEHTLTITAIRYLSL